ncbi:T9SS type A sorting domain-containing protein [Altibacter lentus]|uniref:T9SS type A sorting domain-containing protein n=1 Tax=Altibacter lentus TaxID=1223410 RepID=UPI000558070C|nr:T9SS type A sorting domain-containing protein [Altibacter lentus]
MNAISTYLQVSFFTIFVLCVSLLKAQDRIAVLQDPVVVLLDPNDGSILDPSFIDLTPLDPGTPKALLQVVDEIWITDQIRDRIDRFDIAGNYLSTIGGQVAGGGLDNVRGMELVNGEVWVTNAGTNNGAPGNAIVRFDLDGNNLGFFATTGNDSTFDIIDVGSGEVYISYIGSESKIERRDYTGNVLGNILNQGIVNFIQQIEVNTTNNSVYAAVFSVTGPNSSGLYEFSITDGSILNYWNEGNLRGVAILQNDNVLVSNAAGVRSLNPNTGTSTVINSASSQYFGRISLTPCTPPPTPTGNASQTFNDGATLADIVVSPANVTWFATEADAMTGANPLPLSTVLVDATTYYAVSIVDNCLSDPLAVTVNIVLGASDFDQHTLRVYPNPAKNILTVQYSGIIQRVLVMNLLGQQILEQSAHSESITLDVSTLKAAVYLLTIEAEDKQHTLRFIKME